jgi:hypothetical protein
VHACYNTRGKETHTLSHAKTQEEAEEALKTFEDYRAKCNVKQEEEK